ncbi:MAG: nicotinate-nucleotide adenylyltransferase [Actinomycetota bacterium]
MAQRVGLLGGTFDPPHVGHLILADQVRDQLDLHEVRLVVANVPWQKVGARVITDAGQRLEMVEAAVADAPGLVASRVELDLGGPSYTADTLDHLERLEPDVTWFVIVGSDAAAGLPSWHRADELRRRARFAVADRPGTDRAELPAGWDLSFVEMPQIEVSSTEIRALVAAGRSVRHLMPAAVVQRIERWGLYRLGP